MNETAYERVMKRVEIPDNKNDCWIWCGPVNNAGYGMLRNDEMKMTTVHRIIADYHGLDIKNHEAQHTCLNKRCVNPKHLVEGKVKDRHHRIVNKHGKYFTKPKVPFRTCEHCKRTTYFTWFSRVHKYCYPGMLSKYIEYMQKHLV